MSEANQNDSATSEELSTTELDGVVGGGGRNSNSGGTATTLDGSVSKAQYNVVESDTSGYSSTGTPVITFAFPS